MPIYNDSKTQIVLNLGSDKGITALVKGLGIAKWSSKWKFVADIESNADCKLKILFWSYADVIDEAIVLSGSGGHNLHHNDLNNGSEKVASSDGLIIYERDRDYTIDYLNGVISRIGDGRIGDGDTVLVSYQYEYFVVESDEKSFIGTGSGRRHIISFEDWVLGGETDYFYVTLVITDWGGNSSINLTLYSSYIVKSYDSLLMNYSGNIVRSLSFYNTGVMIDLIDDLDLRDARYTSLAREFERRVVPIGSVIAESEGIFPRAFVDGSQRIYNGYGDSIQVVKFDWNRVGGSYVETIDVVYVEDIPNPGDRKITCATSIGSDQKDYVGPGFYDFVVIDDIYVQNIRVWIDLERALNAGASMPIIGDITTKVVRKYLAADIIAYKGFKFEDRIPNIFTFLRVVDKTLFEERVDFDKVTGIVDLAYDAFADKGLCLLLRDGISIPNDRWDFDDIQLDPYVGNISKRIRLDLDEIDLKAEYRFIYKICQYIVFDINLERFKPPYINPGIEEMYMLPFIDWFILRGSGVNEVMVTENVIFDSYGLGKLRYFSNEKVMDVVIKRIRGANETLLPVESVILLEDDRIRIDPVYVSNDSFYIVTYKGLVADAGKLGNARISWRYEEGENQWSSWVEWNRRDLVPWKFWDDINKVVRTIDSSIQIRVEVDTQSSLFFVKGAGLVVLSLRDGEVM